MERLNDLRTSAQLRERAVLRQVKDTRTKMQQEVASGIVDNPALILDAGFREAGFESAISTYKRILYLGGITPIEIQTKIAELRDRIGSRNGKVGFIKSMQGASVSLIDSKLTQNEVSETHDTVINEHQEALIG